MSEYELVDLLNSTMSLLLSGLVAYISIVSAYLVVAYLAGSKLTKQQAIVVSLLLIFGAGLCIFALWGVSTRVGFTVLALNAVNPGYPVAFGAGYREALVVSCVLGLIASLHFMWKIRSSTELTS
jgi:uncharacterized membrane protein YqjE